MWANSTLVTYIHSLRVGARRSSKWVTSVTKKNSWNETTLPQSWKFYNRYFTAASMATSAIVVAVEDEIQQFSVSSDEEDEDVELW